MKKASGTAATVTAATVPAAVIAAGTQPMIVPPLPAPTMAQTADIMQANPATPIHVLAGKLKTDIATANTLLREYRASKANGNGKEKHWIDAGDLAEETTRAKSRQKDVAKKPTVMPVAPVLQDKADEAKMQAARERAAKAKLSKPKSAADVAPMPEEEEPKAERLSTLAAKASRKRLGPPKPSGKEHEAVLRAGFKLAQMVPGGAQQPDGTWLHGYTHDDGRAAVISIIQGGEPGSTKLALRYSTGHSVAGTEALRHLPMNRKQQKEALTVLRKKVSSEDRARRNRERMLKTAQERVARGEDAITRSQEPKLMTVQLIDGLPSHVVRAVEMLGGITLQRYDLQVLRGDKFYGKRMGLLKKLFNKERVLAAECGINNLISAFYSAVGVEDGKSAAARAEIFAKRCKSISAKSRVVKSKVTRNEKKLAQQAKRDGGDALHTSSPLRHRLEDGTVITLTSRFVPGRILDAPDKLSKKKQAHKEAQEKQELFYTLAVTPETYPVPKPDAEVFMNHEDIRLLEDPANGIAMLQVERPNSQGAICVYNNGVRVASGVIPTEKLKTLRPVGDKVDIVKAVNQFLNPIVPSVSVTPVAVRHLTAVLEHCKEIIAMTAETVTVKNTKFAPPAKKTTAAKAPKAKTAKAPKAKAEKKPREAGAPRANGYAGKSIKVLNKEHGAREGTKRAIGMEIILKSKTTDDAIPKLEKAGCDNSFIAFAVKSGFVKLV